MQYFENITLPPYRYHMKLMKKKNQDNYLLAEKKKKIKKNRIF